MDDIYTTPHSVIRRHLPLRHIPALNPLRILTPTAATHTLHIKHPFPGPVRHTDVPDLLADLIPIRAPGLHVAHVVGQQPVCPARDQEAAEEIQVVDVGGTLGDGLADGADEADDVDEDAADVGGVAPPVEAEGVVVRGRGAGGVEVFDLEVAAADEVVVADNDACDGGEEDGVGAEVGGEVVGGGEEVPRKGRGG